MDELPRWTPPTRGCARRLHEHVAEGLGIGLNTGLAQVGNTGSQYKFKYGPSLGDTVNVASRVQGLTKYLHAAACLLTAATRSTAG